MLLRILKNFHSVLDKGRGGAPLGPTLIGLELKDPASILGSLRSQFLLLYSGVSLSGLCNCKCNVFLIYFCCTHFRHTKFKQCFHTCHSTLSWMIWDTPILWKSQLRMFWKETLLFHLYVFMWIELSFRCLNLHLFEFDATGPPLFYKGL